MRAGGRVARSRGAAGACRRRVPCAAITPPVWRRAGAPHAGSARGDVRYRPVLLRRRRRRAPSGPLASLIAQGAMRGPVGKTLTCRTCGRGFERIRRADPYLYCKGCTARADREIARKARRNCRECGNTFSPKTPAARYCSDACRSAGARRAVIERERRLMADPEKRARRLASARAYAAAHPAGKRGKKRPTRAGRGAARPRRSAAAAEPYACALCGRDFAPYGGGRHPVHCKRCSAKADREIGEERTLNCKECNKKFTTSNHTVRYCSAKCRTDTRRRVALERYHSRMADPEERALAAARQRARLAAGGAREKGRGRRPGA